MVSIGIRELKQRTSNIIRQVRENGEIIEITYHGEPVAQIIPIQSPTPTEEEMAAILTDIDQLAAEIGVQWPEGVSALDAVNDVRREL